MEDRKKEKNRVREGKGKDSDLRDTHARTRSHVRAHTHSQTHSHALTNTRTHTNTHKHTRTDTQDDKNVVKNKQFILYIKL